MGNFKSLRIMYGKTQAETARALGVSEDTVARREAEDEKLSLRDVRILAGFFGCSQNEFLVEHANPPQPPDPAEAENDIKKHFRYVSFNSERNQEVNSKGENHA